MGKFDRYAFSAQPSFDEAATRKAFSRAVPLKTLVIYCYDPRAAEIPTAVAKLFCDVAQHLFGIQNIVVVHHSYCGATSFTADGIIDAYGHEHHLDISNLYQRSSICISDYEASLKHDTALVRAHDGTPRHVNIFGYFYDIDTGALIEVVRDIRRQ
jgi:carbonic anhydrase